MKLIKIILLFAVLAAVSVAACHYGNLNRLSLPDGKWMWIQQQLHDRPPADVDYVFIGSSRTWCAVRSRQIEAAFPGTRVWNLGRHWIGRDIDFLVLEQLLRRHRVRHVLVEIIGQEKFAPHQYARYIISPQQAAEEAAYHFGGLRAKDYLTYSPAFKERVKHVLGYAAELSLRLYRSGLEAAWRSLRGDKRLDAEMAANEETGGFFVRDAQRRPREEFVKTYGRFQPYFPVAKGPFLLPPGSYPDYYLQKMAALADRYDTRLSFVFISDFAAVLPSDQMYQRLGGLGDVYIPGLRRLYQSRLWRDKNHVYGEGAVLMTEEIIRLLREGPAAAPEFEQYTHPGK